VLLDGGEAHAVVAGEGGDGCLGCEGAAEDVAAGGVSERPEEAVKIDVGDWRMKYNHMVVYKRAARVVSRVRRVMLLGGW
jgi:hypothetical protein